MQRSQILFNKITDRLSNHDFSIESATGLIYDALTEAQRHFMEDLKCQKVEYEIDLFPGVEEYQIDDWIISMSNYRFKRATTSLSNDSLNPLLEIPSLGGIIKVIDDQNEIVTGDQLIVDAFIRPVADEDVIEDDKDPMIEKSFDNLMVEYVLAPYRTKTNLFRSIEQVEQDVKRLKRNQTGMNSGEVITIDGITKF